MYIFPSKHNLGTKRRKEKKLEKYRKLVDICFRCYDVQGRDYKWNGAPTIKHL